MFMETTTPMTVTAEIMYDPTHLVGYDLDEATGESTDREEGRWILFMETPGGDFERTAVSPATLVGFADRWGKDRGVSVTIKFLNTVGG